MFMFFVLVAKTLKTLQETIILGPWCEMWVFRGIDKIQRSCCILQCFVTCIYFHDDFLFVGQSVEMFISSRREARFQEKPFSVFGHVLKTLKTN